MVTYTSRSLIEGYQQNTLPHMVRVTQRLVGKSHGGADIKTKCTKNSNETRALMSVERLKQVVNYTRAGCFIYLP